MKRVRNLLFGVGMFAALASGVTAAWARPASASQRPCATQTTESACQACCAWIGLDYVWDNPGCGCL